MLCVIIHSLVWYKGMVHVSHILHAAFPNVLLYVCVGTHGSQFRVAVSPDPYPLSHTHGVERPALKTL